MIPDVSHGRAAKHTTVRRLSFSLYLLVALAELLHWAIVPLIPAFAARFGLSETQSGALVASTGLATLVISLPAGMLADRLGPRRLTLGAGAVLTVTGVGQGLAPTYGLLLTARLVFGVGFGILWTAALAWLSAAASRDGASAFLGASVTSAGVGTVVAPAFAGLVAGWLGLAAPFLVAAVLALVATVLLATAKPGSLCAPAEKSVRLVTLRAAGRDPGIVAALVAILLAGLGGGALSILVPLELHAAGFSGASIGLVFSTAAVVFIVVSAATARLGERAVRVAVVLFAALAYGATISPATASGTAVAVVATLCLSAAARALLYTAAYPLGAARAPHAGVGVGTVMGLLNGAWALTAVLGPLGAGALSGVIGSRATYGLLQACALVAVGGVWLHVRRAPRWRAPPATEPCGFP